MGILVQRIQIENPLVRNTWQKGATIDRKFIDSITHDRSPNMATLFSRLQLLDQNINQHLHKPLGCWSLLLLHQSYQGIF
jgi:hypothetical protein